MKYEKVKMLGMYEQLKRMKPLSDKLFDEIFNIGYGISDMDYMGWTDNMPATRNMKALYDDLNETIRHLKKCISEGLGEDEDNQSP